MTEGKRNEAGIFIPLPADEKEQVQKFIEKNAPDTPSILADILGA